MEQRKKQEGGRTTGGQPAEGQRLKATAEGAETGWGGHQGPPAFLPPAPPSTPRQGSVPDFQEAVPGAGSYGHAVVCHAKAADPVVVASEDACKKRDFLAMKLEGVAAEATGHPKRLFLLVSPEGERPFHTPILFTICPFLTDTNGIPSP